MTTLYDAFDLLTQETILLVVGSLLLLLGHSKSAAIRRYVPAMALAALVIAMGYTWTYGGDQIGREIPGIRIDTVVTFVRLIAYATGILLLFVNWQQPAEEESGEFFGMLLFSTMGLTLTAAATDMIVLFFAIEIVSVPLYIMIALSAGTARTTESTFKYFFLGALAAALMVYGFSFIYGATGTTTLITEHTALASVASYVTLNGPSGVMLTVGLVLAFAGFAFKMTAVPFHFYAADVYQGAPSSVTAVLGFLPKTAGLLATLKLFAVLDWSPSPAFFWMVWVVAALTMTAGNTLALLQTNVKRMLAYSGVAHTGYMLMGVLVGPIAATGGNALQDGLAAVLFYVTVYAIMNTGAFAVLSFLRTRGRETEEIADLSGLVRTEPFVALIMTICMFSLMGMPITAGFWGKVFLFSGALSVGAENPYATAFVVLAVIGVLNSAVGAAYYLRVIGTCFLGEPTPATQPVKSETLRIGIAICGVFVIGLGVLPRELFRAVRTASERRTVPAAVRVTDADEHDALTADQADAEAEKLATSSH